MFNICFSSSILNKIANYLLNYTIVLFLNCRGLLADNILIQNTVLKLKPRVTLISIECEQKGDAEKNRRLQRLYIIRVVFPTN